MTAVAATARAALAEAWANRAGFWTQVVAMVVNDVAWVAFWVLFFNRVGSVRSWDMDLVLLLLAVLTTAGGVVLGLLGNARRIGALVADGGLDAVLALPVSPLAHLLVRRVDATNLGDIAFGILLFAIVGDPSPGRVAVYVLGVATATTVLTGFLVATGSLAFFAGRNDAGELGFHAMLLTAAYPVDVFSGAAKVLLYTVVPAAFVGAVPARLLDSFDPLTAAAAVGVALLFAVAGWGTFTLGLRRYTSGAVWSRA
ncbi:MAG TPA: ABC-2 family transporter protein [Acidimicrobiales bacterium]